MRFARQKPTEPSRRVLAAQRQAETHADPAAASFQRNRALYSASLDTKEAPASERQSTHELRRRRQKLFRYLAASLVAVGLLVAVLYNLSVTIRVVTPAPIQQKSIYANILTDYYKERPLERLQFFTDQSALAMYFLRHSPEVKSVDIASGGLITADLRLTFRQAVVQWSSGKTTYFVDEAGVTFEKNYLTPPKVTVRDESGVSVEAGKEIINRQFLAFLGKAVAGFSQNGLTVTDVILPSQTVRQAVFRLENTPYQVKMTVDRPASEQVTQALQAIRWFTDRQLNPEMVDVRAERRAFYR